MDFIIKLNNSIDAKKNIIKKIESLENTNVENEKDYEKFLKNCKEIIKDCKEMLKNGE